jgi:tRNA-dihydrouridine synthase A
VHARKAVLGGLSPRENREVPPLRFDVVRRLKQDFPLLWIAVNGGLRTLEQSSAALSWCDAVMLGREVYHRPALLAQLHEQVFSDGWHCPDPGTLLERMASYAEREVAAGEHLSAITRHMLGLYAGQPGARRFRQWLSEGARKSGAGAGAVAQVAILMREAAAMCVYADA